jgi:ABC-type bacteriocin/lantibiotic exporter with double-glycine peptidase domain
MDTGENALPPHLFEYAWRTTWLHQLPLLGLTAATFLLQVVPLELQRRIVNDVVKNRHYQAVLLLCAVYLTAVAIQGGTKLTMNVYRGWLGERGKRDLRRRVYTALNGHGSDAQAEGQGTAVSLVVAEVEPVGAFVGSSISEPLLQFGILASVIAYIVHLELWMAAAALVLFVPQLIFVPLMQHGMNRRTGIRVWMLRQIGGGVITSHDGDKVIDPMDATRIDRVMQLNMGILRIKFTMNFLMNLCSQLQVVAGLLIGGWLVLHQRIEIGGIVAFISGVKQLNDPWGDVVNYFRDASLSHVKYRMLTAALNDTTPDGSPPQAQSSAGGSQRTTARAFLLRHAAPQTNHGIG